MGMLPAGYQELTYIESTGTQYIDTDVKASSDVNIELQFEDLNIVAGEYASLFGASTANALFSNNTSYVNFSNSSNNQEGELPASGVIKIENKKYYQDGELKKDFSGTPDFSGDLNLYIFADNNGSARRFASVKLCRCKIEFGTSDRRNLIPCKRLSDGAIGMFDLVSQSFFGNSGTGEFIAGAPVIEPTWGSGLVRSTIQQQEFRRSLLLKRKTKLPAGYTELQWIQSTGTQMLSTNRGIRDNRGFLVIMSRSETESDKFIFGCRQVSPSNTRCLLGQMNGKLYFGWNNNTPSDIRPNFSPNVFHEFRLNFKNDRKAVFDGQVIQDNLPTLLGPIDVNNSIMRAFGIRSDIYDVPNTGITRIKRIFISSGTDIITELVPCYNSNFVPGMYDVLMNAFRTNSGTDPFMKGPDV